MPEKKYKAVHLGDDPWSLDLRARVRKTPHYLTAMQWIANRNVPMTETKYYWWLIKNLKKYGTVWGGIINNRGDVKRQYEKFAKMFDVAPHWDLEEDVCRKIGKTNYYFGRIMTKVCDNGDITVWDGNHRIALLEAFGLPIEIVICERLPKWEQLSKDVRNLYPQWVYQQIPHPDFYDLVCPDNSDKEKKLRQIVIDNHIKSVLDLGSCHGHLIYAVRDLLDSATAVENNPVRYNVVKVLMNKLGFNHSNLDIFAHVQRYNTRYHCVFALAVFHHFAKQYPIDAFKKLMERIQKTADILVYELPEPDEDQYAWMYTQLDMHKFIRLFYRSVTCVPLEHRKLFICKV